MRKITILLSSIFVLSTASGFAQTSTSTVRSGERAVIESLVSWDKNCQTVSYPKVVLRQVSKGTVYYQNADLVIPSTREAGRCAGKTVRGTNILYLAPEGFTGGAKVRITIKPAHINRTFTLTKDIRVLP